MPRPLLFLFLFVAGLLAWPGPARAADALPTRPVPFRFVNDEAQLLSAADAKKLEAGLRRYADNTGTQLVVLTVPTLGGRPVADYAREIGQAWGVGQEGKDNGLVLLLSEKERQVSIQAGAGLREVITPALVARVINQDMTPSFKQNNYFAGLRTGLNTLMLAANPGSAPRPTTPDAATETGAEATGATAAAAAAAEVNRQDELPATLPEPASNPMADPVSSAEPASSGFGLGLGALTIGAVIIGGVLWLLFRLFKRFTSGSASAATPAATPSGSNAPDFLPNQRQGNYGNNNRQQAPDFLPNRATNSGGSGMGGMLMTGAAAAAGAYLGNRMATGHESGPDTGHAGEPLHPDAAAPLGYGNAGPATSGGFPALGNEEAASNSPAPDYFSDEAAANDAPDYFSSDDNDSSSYDDPSSGDSGGGGFDDTNNNSGSW